MAAPEIPVNILHRDERLTIIQADCRQVLPEIECHAVITDPPYGDTSLVWDKMCRGWVSLARAPVIWCFSSLRHAIAAAPEFKAAGYKLAQEVIWEKHNGSSFHSDRFRRVHELILQWYRGNWGEIYKSPVVTQDASPRTIRRKQRPPHMGAIADSTYRSEDGGSRLMRSVIRCRSMHGRAIHPTQKPEQVIDPLVEYSVPPDGLVLDPFMGSGATIACAMAAGRRAVGIEINPEYCRSALERLRHRRLF